MRTEQTIKQAFKIAGDYVSAIYSDSDMVKIHPEVIKTYVERKDNPVINKLFGDRLIIEQEVEIKKDNQTLYDEISSSDLTAMVATYADKEIVQDDANCSDWHISPPASKEQHNSRAMVIATTPHHIMRGVLPTDCFGNSENIIITRDGKEKKLSSGTKITKLWKAIIPDKDNLNKVINRYSQLISQKKIKGTLCLSIHPMDYFTVSDSGCGWSSCFSVANRSEYCASTSALMQGTDNTIIAYLKSGTKTLSLPNGDEWNAKKWRTYVTVAEDGDLVHFGKHYPNEIDGIEKEIQKILQKRLKTDLSQSIGLEGEEDAFNTTEELCFHIETPNLMYNDFYGISHGTILLSQNLVEQFKNRTGVEMKIGARDTMCVCCGLSNRLSCDRLLCHECSNESYCEYCDEYHSADFVHYSDDWGGTVCKYCAEEHFVTCDCCEELALRPSHPFSDTMHITVLERYAHRGGFLCETCCNGVDSDAVEQCSNCGSIFLNMTGTDVQLPCCEE